MPRQDILYFHAQPCDQIVGKHCFIFVFLKKVLYKPIVKTINADEILKFQRDSAHWWDESGAFAPLHRVNPVRMEFMVGVMEKYGFDHPEQSDPLSPQDGERAGVRGQSVRSEAPAWTHLDVGCGGGLVAEPFARLGARVTGLDADAQAINVARTHAVGVGLDIDYHAQSIEEFRKDCHPGNREAVIRDLPQVRELQKVPARASRVRDDRSCLFDTITALEIIEHVDAPDLFLDELTACVRPGGVVFISTLNRTMKSFALGVIAAEYILGWVPRGTHDWRKFIKPSDLTSRMRARGCDVIAASGIVYRPVTRDFALVPHDLDVNYIMAFQKIV